MALGQVLKARNLMFGTLPVNLLDRSSLSPLARLLWAVLDSCGQQHVRPSIEFLAIRCGLNPQNRTSVYRALDELVSGGFLEIQSSNGAKGTNNYFLKLPDYCLCDTPAVLELALKAEVPTNENGWGGAKGRSAGRKAKAAPFDRAAWILGRHQVKQQQLATAQLALAAPAAATATAPAAPAASAAAVTAPTATPLQLAPPAGWEGYAPAFERIHGRGFAWTKTSCADAARIARQIPAELVPGTWGAFLQDPYWKAKGHPWAALKKCWADYVPARVALPTCAHEAGQLQLQDGHENGRPGTWRQLACKHCGKIMQRSFEPKHEAVQLDYSHPFMQEYKRTHGYYPGEGPQD